MRYRFGVLAAMGTAAALFGGVYFVRDFALASEESPLGVVSWIACAAAFLGAIVAFSGMLPLKALDELEDRCGEAAPMMIIGGYVVGGWALLITGGLCVGWLRGAELGVAILWGVTALAAAAACVIGGWFYAPPNFFKGMPTGIIIVTKSCGNCQQTVPSNLGLGSKCPHCGAKWGREEEKKEKPWWQRLFIA